MPTASSQGGLPSAQALEQTDMPLPWSLGTELCLGKAMAREHGHRAHGV